MLMAETMRCEGFYRSSAGCVPELGVHSGFVGLKGSSDGIFANSSNTVLLAFSGECFHGPALASVDLLIRLYENEGEKMVEKLNGVFCGILIDRKRRRILLFNDRYGIQRVYFHAQDGNFYFASEARALLRILPRQREFDPDGLTDFLTFGSTLNWKTLFRGIEIMPGASLWTFKNGKLRKEQYFSPETWETQPPLAPSEFEDRFQLTFKHILPRYFDSSQKVGIALTGGLDTRMIMACRPQNNGHTTCYTFSGNNGWTQDDKIAARVAAASHLEHSLVRLDPDFFSNFGEHADKTIFATDGCATIFNSHEIYLNRKARELAPVRLTGNFGSEILRGHSTLKPASVSPQLFSADWRSRVSARAESLALERTRTHPVTVAAFKEIPWHLYGNLAAGRSQLQFRSPYLDNDLVALAFQTPDPLRKSSLPSCDLIRASNFPLSEIPTDRGFGSNNSGLRFVARRAFAEVTFKLDYYTVSGLPNSLALLNSIYTPIVKALRIAGMHKFLRYSAWFRNELTAYVREVVNSPRVRGNGFWNPKFIDRLAGIHMSGRRDYSAEINAVMTIEAIERLLFRDLSREI